MIENPSWKITKTSTIIPIVKLSGEEGVGGQGTFNIRTEKDSENHVIENDVSKIVVTVNRTSHANAWRNFFRDFDKSFVSTNKINNQKVRLTINPSDKIKQIVYTRYDIDTSIS